MNNTNNPNTNHSSANPSAQNAKPNFNASVNKDASKMDASDVSLQEKIMKQIHDLGDSIERAGEKVEKSGWESIGQAIYKIGNTLEHFNDSKSADLKAKSKSNLS